MHQLLSLSKEEQTQYFLEATNRSAVIDSPVIIEKDFWVCFALKQIFSIPQINNEITFKGGTSLSKCYDLINRFSEDCDLTLSKEFIGVDETPECILAKTGTQRRKTMDRISKAAQDKVHAYIKPLLIEKFSDELIGRYGLTSWKIESDNNDPDNQTLLFHYPSVLAHSKNAYIQSAVKLEFGARGDTTPNESKQIVPTLFEILKDVLTEIPVITVNALSAKRTFWEKATLLHAEHYRKIDKPLKNRIFRHYYDIVMLDENGVTVDALNDLALLEAVVLNKTTYFASSSANYESANIGTLKLMPNPAFFENLRRDSREMSSMFFGEAPNFDDILNRVQAIETLINQRSQ